MQNRNIFSKFSFIAGIVIVAAAARLVPHAPNLAPIAAIALLSGATLRFPWSISVPLLSMALSDLFIGFSPLSISISVYFSFAAITLAGLLLRKFAFWKLPVISVGSSLLFYVITNFAVWLSSGMYPHSIHGLYLCYLYALPFFKNTLLGDLIYTTIVFTALHFAFSKINIFQREIFLLPSAKNSKN